MLTSRELPSLADYIGAYQFDEQMISGLFIETGTTSRKTLRLLVVFDKGVRLGEFAAACASSIVAKSRAEGCKEVIVDTNSAELQTALEKLGFIGSDGTPRRIFFRRGRHAEA